MGVGGCICHNMAGCCQISFLDLVHFKIGRYGPFTRVDYGQWKIWTKAKLNFSHIISTRTMKISTDFPFTPKLNVYATDFTPNPGFRST